MKLFRRILKILGFGIVIIIFLLIVFAGITQTRFFKNGVRSIIIAEMEKQLNGTVHIGKIDGNFLNTVSIESLSVYYGNNPVLAFGSIEVSYEPLALLRNVILIDSLSIQSPVLQFIHLEDTSWNIGKLFKPADDSPKGKFNWTIQVRTLEIKHGYVSLRDSLKIPEGDTATYAFPKLDYHNFTAEDINLLLKGTYKQNDVSAQITSLRFYSSNPKFILGNFRGDFLANEHGVSAKNVSILTRNSLINLDATIRKENIFDGVDIAKLKGDSTRLHLAAERIDFDELKFFVHDVGFLEGNASLDLDVDGRFDSLVIRRLNIDTYSTQLKIAGTLEHLDQPENLFIKANIGDSRIDPADANKLMPSFNLPSFEKVGSSSLYGQFIGTPVDFKPRLIMKGPFGSFDVMGGINLKDTIPAYQLNFTCAELDLAKLTNQEDLKSSLTLHGTLAGEGTTFDDLQSQLDLLIDHAQIKNFVADSSTVNIKALYSELETQSGLHLNGATAQIKADFDLENIDNPLFKSQVLINSLDISRMIPSSDLSTNLNFQGSFNGSGKSLDSLNLEATILLHQSEIESHILNEQEITVSLNQTDDLQKHLNVESSVADLNLTGNFDLDILFTTLPRHASSLISSILHHTAPDDSTRKFAMTENEQNRSHPRQEPMNCSYSIQIKDLKPVSKTLQKDFGGTGTLKGEISGTDENLSFSCNVNAKEFFVGNISDGMFFQNASVNIEATNLTKSDILNYASGEIRVETDHAIFDGTVFDSTSLNFTYANTHGRLHTQAKIDSLLGIEVFGNISMQPQTYVFDFDTLHVNFDGYEWQNEDDVQARLNTEGLRILHALFKHNRESIYFSGKLTDSSKFEMQATLRQIDINGFSSWFRRNDKNANPSDFQGIVNADIDIQGTPSSPIFSLSINGKDIKYHRIPFGTVDANINYQNSLATVSLTAKPQPTDTVPLLTVTGTLPINLAFQNVDKRFPDIQQDFKINSNGFSIAILEDVVPQLKNLTGTFIGQAILRGTPQHPLYSGALTIPKAQFIFSPNNIAYQVSGDVIPSGEELNLSNFEIINLTDRGHSGHAIANGSLTLKEFELTYFDVTTVGSLLLMSDSTKRVVKAMYGVLFAETDSNGVRMSGTSDRPYLAGNLYVQDANIVFPPTKNQSSDASALTLTYYQIDDTSKAVKNVEQTTLLHQFFTATDTIVTSSAKDEQEYKPGFLDLLRYNLRIETRGPTRVRMIFTPTTNEELYAELDGSVSAINDKGTPTIYGEISLTSNSYYNFLQHFNATGNLKFIGQWDNPELNVKAFYEGIREVDASGSARRQRVIVQIDITGTRYEPKPELSMKIQDETSKEPIDYSSKTNGGDVQSDAISFILTGKFRDDLTSEERGKILSNSAGASLTSTLLSGVFSDFLKEEFPFIRTADFSYSGTGTIQEGADLRIGSELFKGYLKFGGRILQNIGNANVSYQLSLGNAFEVRSIRNLFFEIERKVQNTDFTGGSADHNTITNAARLFYRISF